MEDPQTKYDKLQEASTDQVQPVITQPGAAGPPPYPDQGYPTQGHPGQGYPAQGYPAQGYPAQGYPVQGYPAAQAAQQSTTNVVVVQQQPTVVVQGKRGWHSGLCACFDDMGSCCCGLFCEPCLLLDITQRMGEDCCFCFCCPFTAMFGLRVQLRTEQNIQGSLCNDYCAILYCHSCVLCQMSRELKHLGR